MSFYDDASWLLIPSGIEEDIVFAQKPISGLGDLTFTRASDATYTDASGVVRRSPYNLLQFSEQFDNAAWSKIRTTITVDTTVAPNGTLTADALIGNGVSGTHYVNSTAYNVVAGVSYSVSIYAKKNTNNFIQLDISGLAFGVNAYANFDLNNGILGTVGAGITASIQSVGDGWYRCVISRASTSTTAAPFYIALITNSNSTAFETNTLSTSVFIWGAQIVEGTSALDYFPTTNRQDVPRIDFRNADGTLSSCGRLLLEPQRTNSIRNSSMVGAVAGSPGTLPTNWSGTTSLFGITRTIVGTGTENGLPYIDLRVSGTATSTFSWNTQLEANGIITASTGQSWSLSTYAKLISGTAPSTQLTMNERSSGGSVKFAQQNITPTSTLQRFVFSRVLDGGATVVSVTPFLDFNLLIGQTYDFTIRIAAPQMELGAYATTWVPTTTAAVTRIADASSKTGVSSLINTEGTIYWEGYFNAAPTTIFSLFGSNAQNSVVIECVSSTVRAYLVTSNTVRFILTSGTINAGQTFKCAFAYKSGESVFYVNGVQVATSSVAFTFASTLQQINADWSGYNYGSGQAQTKGISQAALLTTRLTNAQLAQLTTL